MKIEHMKRLLLTVLSICLLSTNLTTAVVLAEETKGDSKTETKVIIQNNDLSEEELSILDSKDIVEGKNYYYSAPSNADELVSIEEGYATFKTYQDDSTDTRTWIPVSARLVADNGSIDERSLTIVEENGDYVAYFPSDIAEDAAITVYATYKTYVDVDVATQELRLNTPYWLYQTNDAVEKINNGTSYLRNLTDVNNAIDMSYISLLHQLVNGYQVDMGALKVKIYLFGNPAEFDQLAQSEKDAYYAIINLYNQQESGSLELVTLRNEYNSAYRDEKRDEYILTGLANNLIEKNQEIYNQLLSISNSVKVKEFYDTLVYYNQNSVADVWSTIIDTFATAASRLESATKIDDNKVAYVKHQTDLLVKESALTDRDSNLSYTISDMSGDVTKHTVSNTKLELASAEVDASMGRHTVVVNVIANVIDKEANDTNETVVLDAKVTDGKLTFNEGTTQSVVVAAIEEEFISTILNNSQWQEYAVSSDEDGHYTMNVTKNTIGDSLTGDAEYTVVFNPKNYTISDNIDETPETVPYGYNLTLPNYKNEPCVPGEECLVKTYDYTIAGSIYGEGEVVRIVGDTTITRELGKAKEAMRLYDVLAEDTDYAMNSYSSNILKNAAVFSKNVEYRIPDQTDVNKGNIEITLDDSKFPYVLTAASYESGIPGMVWKPVTWTTNTGVSGTFTDGVATINTDMKKVSVTYELVVTDRDNSGDSKVTDDELLAGLNIPYRLITETKGQISALSKVANQYDALGEANSALSLLLPGLIQKETNADSKQAMEQLRDEALNEDGNLIIYEMIKNWSSLDGNKVVINKVGAMKHYYVNYEAYINQLDLLIEVLPKFKNSTAINEVLESYPQYSDITSDLDAIAAKLDEAKEDMSIPYVSAIDINNSAVDAVFNIAFDEQSSAIQYSNLSENKLTDYAEVSLGVGTVIVPVKVSLGTTSVTDSIDIDSGLWTEEKIAILNEKLTAMTNELANKVGANWKYYVASNNVINMPSKGDAIDTLNTIEKGFKAKEINVTIVNVEDENDVLDTQTISIEDLAITLPAPKEKEISYRFKNDTQLVGSSVYGAAGVYNVTLDEFNTIFTNGSLKLTYSEVNALIEFFEAMNEGTGSYNSGYTLMEKGDSYAAVLLIDTAEASKMADVLQGVIQEMALNEDYDFVALERSSSETAMMEKISDSEGVRRVISMQGMLNAIVENNGFSLDKYIGLIDANTGEIKNTLSSKLINDGYKVIVNKNDNLNLGSSLIETSMYIGKDSNNNIEIPFYIAIQNTKNAEANKELRSQLVSINGIMDLDIKDNRVNFGLTIGDRYYQALLSGMLMLGYADLEDVSNVDIEAIGTFCKEQLNTVLFNEKVTGKTLQNTLSQFGYGEAVSNDEAKTIDSFLHYVRGFNNNTTLTVRTGIDEGYKENYYQAYMTTDLSSVIGKMVPEALTSMLKEQSISLPIEMSVSNIGTAYDAMVFDNSNSGLGKIYFTQDLPAISEKLGTNAVVALLSDIDEEIVLKNPIVLELNGNDVQKINASNVTGGSVKIFNSALVNVGKVAELVGTNFNISGGSFEILDQELIVDGYRQDTTNGNVVSNFFEIVEDEDGNIDLNISTNYLSSALETDVVYLGTDLALKLGLNFYTTAGIAIGENKDSLNTIYETNFPNLTEQFLLNTKGGMLNEVLQVINCEGSTKFANMLIDDITDFGAIAEAIKNGNPIASYAMQLKDWDINLVYADEDYISVSLGAARAEDKSFTVRVTGAKTSHLVNLFEELDKVATIDAEVALDRIAYEGKDNGGFEIDYAGEFDGTIDFTSDYRYTALMGIILSYGLEGDIDAAVQTYLTEGTTEAFVKEFNKLTIGDVLNAVKNAGGVSFNNLCRGLNVSAAEKEEISKLASLYDTYIRGLDIFFTKLDTIERLEIPAKILNKHLGDSYKLVDGVHTHTIGQEWRTLSLSGTVKLFAEKEAVSELDIYADITEKDDLILGFEVSNTENTIDLDVVAEGIRREDMNTYFKVDKGVITKVVYNDETTLVKNGDTVTVYAAETINAPESEWVSEEYTIRILGDVYVDGRVNTFDSTLVLRNYVYGDSLTDNQLWAANTYIDTKINTFDSTLILRKYVYGTSGYTSMLGQ